MTTLVWDNPEDRSYQSGIDHGVLYLSDGTGVAWNGLTSITEAASETTEAVYYQGRLIHNIVKLGEFKGNLSAISYPEEFLDYCGVANVRPGVRVRDQKSKTFGLSYRTMINDNDYKLNVAYNVLPVTSERSFATISSTDTALAFSWALSSVPEKLSGFAPSSIIHIDSRKVSPETIDTIKDILYGTEGSNPILPSMQSLVNLILAD